MARRSHLPQKMEAAVAAKIARLVLGNRYPQMGVRVPHGPQPPAGKMAVTIAKTEYMMTRAELETLRDMLESSLAVLDKPQGV